TMNATSVRGYPHISTDCRSSSSTHSTGTCELRSGATRSRSSGSYPWAMAAAKRARSLVCGSRLSCFAVIMSRSERRVAIEIPHQGCEKARTGCRATRAQYSAQRRATPAVHARHAFVTFRPMFPKTRVCVCAALIFIGAAATATAQASLFLPRDDARLPLLEHLIARGDVEDPSPMIRPFRFRDAVRVL